MAKQKFEKFVELVLRSKLVGRDQVAGSLADFKRQAKEDERQDSEALGEWLMKAGLLTRWQHDKLQEGKYKTFFLGKYKLLGHLGSGGMSTVYLAEHTVMHRRVALKVLPKHRVDDSSYLGRFHREARAAAAVDHRNIVRAYDIDNEDDIHYLVMEFIDGRDLHSLVKAEGPLDFHVAAEYIAQAADGLQHAHEAGLIHRDVKPGNLLLDPRGVVKVSDLGLARFDESEKASLTMEHNENVLGTADYVAPEQALDSHRADSRADVYSLGCTLFFLLTGHPPFPEGTLSQRLLAHQNQEPPEIAAERPDVPLELVAIYSRMVAKNPAMRYQTMNDVARALRTWLSSVAVVSRSGQPASGSSPGSGKRGPTSEPGSNPKSDPATPGDTVTGRDKDTIKGSSSKLGRSKGLPVARSLETNPYQDLEAVIAPGRSGRMPTTKPTDSVRGLPPPKSSPSKERPSGKQAKAQPPGASDSGELRVNRGTAGELPKWFWIAIAVGCVLTGVFLVLMLQFGR